MWFFIPFFQLQLVNCYVMTSCQAPWQKCFWCDGVFLIRRYRERVPCMQQFAVVGHSVIRVSGNGFPPHRSMVSPPALLSKVEDHDDTVPHSSLADSWTVQFLPESLSLYLRIFVMWYSCCSYEHSEYRNKCVPPPVSAPRKAHGVGWLSSDNHRLGPEAERSERRWRSVNMYLWPQAMTVWVFPVIIPHTKQASSLATAVLALLAHFILWLTSR